MEWKDPYNKTSSEFMKMRWREHRDEMIAICQSGGKVKDKKRPPLSLETRQKISETLKKKDCKPPYKLSPCCKKGYKNVDLFGEEVAEKMRQATIKYNHERIVSEKSRLKMSLAKRGVLNINWKGGITSTKQEIYNTLEMKAWRRAVYRRDNFTCQSCGNMGKVLNAHHIKEVSLYPYLIFDVKNGITLCIDCHKNTENYGGKWKRERMVGAK